MRDSRRSVVRRVVGYARVSSEEQARGSSLQDQQDSIVREATARGLTVERFYVEAESAVHEKIERREQIRALMADVREGDLVLCDKLDRWSRDPEFTYGSIRQILERGASLYAVSDRCDPSTKDGDTMLGVRVLVAREEHKRIKERTVGTRKLLRDRGYYVEGLPPFGYRRQAPPGRKSPVKNVLAVVPEQAEVVREAFRRCGDGHSIGVVLEWLRATTGRKWDKKSVGIMLRHRVYLGEITDSHGAWIKAQHEALLDARTFSRAQDALTHRRLGGPHPSETSRTAGWLVRDLALCAKCGSRMGASYGGGPRTGAKQYTFYLRCLRRCGAKYVPVGLADAAVSQAVLDRLSSICGELARDSEPELVAPVIDFAERREKLQRRRERYIEMYADEQMSREELRLALARVDTERTKIDADEADAVSRSPAATVAVRRSLLAQAGALAAAWPRAGSERRRGVLAVLATAVRLAKGEVPVIDWRPLEQLAERTAWK